MRRVVLEAQVDDERLVADVQLRSLVPARVALDEDPPVREELPGHRLFVEGHLPHPGQDEEALQDDRPAYQDRDLQA